MTDAIPAATLIVLRDRVDAAPDILMVERAGAMAFAPGAMVFPGGRVDPADHAFAHALGEPNSDHIATPRRTTKEAGVSSGLDEDATRRAAIHETSGEAGVSIPSTAPHIAANGQPGEAGIPIGPTAILDRDDTAARIAAIRETIEEAGVPIGLTTMPDAAALATLRRALHDGVPFAAALAAIGATLALDRLVPFARWRPDHRPVRRFDTRFYLARLPADAPPARVDGTENVRLCWTAAHAMLAEADAGRRTLIFPTRCNLERLARFADHAAAVADARATPVRVVAPWSEWRDGEEYLCIPDDLGYPVTAHPLADVRRG